MGLKNALKKVATVALGIGTTMVPGGSAFKQVFDLIDNSSLDPETKAKLRQLRMEQEIQLQQLEFKYLETMTKAAHESFQAEAQSGDWYTRRWRPTFGYMASFLIIYDYGVYPTLHNGAVIELPAMLWQFFGAYLLVAFGGRTWEKITEIKGRNGGGK